MRHRGSISLRLTIGFALVVGALGIASVLMLSHLARVREASRRLQDYVSVYRGALQVRGSVESLSALHAHLSAMQGTDQGEWSEFELLCRELENRTESIQTQAGDEHIQSTVDALAATAFDLRSAVQGQVLALSSRRADDPERAELMRDFADRTSALIAQIRTLSERVAESFDTRVMVASLQADLAWTFSVTASKIVFPVVLLLSLLVVYYTHKSVVGPVSELVRSTQALADGELGGRIEVRGTREFAELADSFNQMAAALDVNQRQLVEAEKLATLGRLAAGVAHEINNPITVIMGYTRMLLAATEEDSSEREQLVNISVEAQQCKNIVNSLLDLSRPSEPAACHMVDIKELIAEVLGLVQALQFTHGVHIDERIPDMVVPLAVGRSRLRQLILNIARNGLEALQATEDACLQVEAETRSREELPPAVVADTARTARAFLVLRFIDNGPGIAAENLQRLFEPFFTTKADGMGLGLAICYNIARGHGGFIDVQSALGEGTTFAVGLPLAEG